MFSVNILYRFISFIFYYDFANTQASDRRVCMGTPSNGCVNVRIVILSNESMSCQMSIMDRTQETSHFAGHHQNKQIGQTPYSTGAYFWLVEGGFW